MLSDGDEERLRLFRLYSKNLAIYSPESGGVFVCPICARFFHEADVLHGPGLKVDLGHCFPQEIGGTHVVLECCECNGRMNRLGDNELVKLYKQWDAMRPEQPGPPIRGHINMPSGPVGVDLSAAGIHGHWQHAHPGAFKEIIQALQDGTPVPPPSMPPVCRKKINVASLHSAHLLYFREFGYGYLGTPGGHYIRRLLVDAESLQDGTFLSVELPKPTDVDPGVIFRIGVCTTPDGEKCLFAALPVADPSVLCQFLLLPGPWDEDAVKFKQLLAGGERWIHRLTFQTIDRHIWQHLVEPEYDNALALAWHGWKPHNVDMTKLMFAISAEANGKTDRKIDAGAIGERLGMASALDSYIQSLSERGFLERAPKREQPHLVRLTPKAITVSRKVKTRGARPNSAPRMNATENGGEQA